MQLRSARVIGFQSFSDSGEVKFAEINLIVGQNNAGKSALLRALLPILSDDRHRTPERWEDFRIPPPIVHLNIELSGDDILSVLVRPGQRILPVPQGTDATTWITNLVAEPAVLVMGSHSPGKPFAAEYPGHGQFMLVDGAVRTAAIVAGGNGGLEISSSNIPQDGSGQIAMELWQSKMFYFSAERMSIGEAAQVYSARLLSNASNLPNVLLMLSGDRGTLFERLVGHLREIFPTVGILGRRLINTEPQPH
jgi:energy-coupling factor transporter ATP-binding protein EcfA2